MALLRPVGSKPTGVYWRRRIVVLGGLLVVVGLVAWACTAGGSPSNQARPATTAATPSHTPAATISAPSEPPGGMPGDGGPGPTYDGGSGGGAAPSAGAGGGTGSTGAGAAGAGAAGAGGGGTGSGNGGAAGSAPPCTAGQLAVSVKSQDTRYPSGTKSVTLQVTVINQGTTTCAVASTALNVVIVDSSTGTRIWGSADCPAGAPAVYVLSAGRQQLVNVPWPRVTSRPGCSSASPAPPYTGTGKFHDSVTFGGVTVSGDDFTILAP